MQEHLKRANNEQNRNYLMLFSSSSYIKSSKFNISASTERKHINKPSPERHNSTPSDEPKNTRNEPEMAKEYYILSTQNRISQKGRWNKLHPNVLARIHPIPPPNGGGKGGIYFYYHTRP